jgi:predicted DNA binding CopG/RHH family protein
MAVAKRTLKDASTDKLAKLQKEVEETVPKKKSVVNDTAMMNTRIPKDLLLKLKIHCVSNEISIQQYITELIQDDLG